MNKIITLNVGGTMYQTTLSTIETQQQDNTLLNIVNHELKKSEDEPIFIDRDGILFRWILHFLRTGEIVDSLTTGVPNMIWHNELAYYFPCLIESDIPNPNDIRDSDEIAQEAMHNFTTTVEQKQKICEQKKKEDYEKRHKIYAIILKYVLNFLSTHELQVGHTHTFIFLQQSPKLEKVCKNDELSTVPQEIIDLDIHALVDKGSYESQQFFYSHLSESGPYNLMIYDGARICTYSKTAKELRATEQPFIHPSPGDKILDAYGPGQYASFSVHVKRNK